MIGQPGLQIGRAAVEQHPRQVGHHLAQGFDRRGIGPIIDVRAGIDRIEGIPGGGADVDIVGCLEVIGVGPEAAAPAFLENTPHGVVHNALRGAAGAGVFPH